ncbi:MAG: KH domain-containing protein [Lentisphaeria bacterium]|nr:KH domain-containing protein [Lentisphaeria bacterium]
MENENELNPTVNAVPEENTAAAEETAESCCCCKDGVCSFEPPAEAVEEAEECDCCCGDEACRCGEAIVAEDVADEKAEKPERVIIPITQDMLDDTRTKLAMMLDYLGLEAEVRSEAGNNKINLIVSSSDAGRIIGRKGQSLENLQFLLNRMMQKNDVNYPKVYVDIDGYSSGTKRAANDRSERPERGERNDRRNNRRDGGKGDRRDRGGKGDRRNGGRRDRGGDGFDMHDENLRMLALDSAKEVRRWGDPKTLPAMNAHDRRIIHVTLEKEADITTDSVGEEPNKSVVISLKK